MKFVLPSIVTLIIFSCSTIYLALEPVEEFDIERYMGKWYEIYRLPNKFEEGLEDITANYELKEDGNIIVTNEGRLVEDNSRLKQAKGKAWIPNSSEPSKLKVSFFWPFSGDYWVLKIDPEYSYALVGDPSGKYLWILSRERRLDPKIVADHKMYASSLGFPVENIISSQIYYLVVCYFWDRNFEFWSSSHLSFNCKNCPFISSPSSTCYSIIHILVEHAFYTFFCF